MTRGMITMLVMSAGLAVSAQQSRDAARPPAVASGTAQITGTVVTGDPQSPSPLRRAVVTLTGEQLATPVVAVTDDAGSFVFASLPADRYSVSASKAGFVPMTFGSRRPGGSGTPVQLVADQLATITITLPKGSVITGTVRDDFGRPAPGVTVEALRFVVSTQTGERSLQSPRFGSAGQVVAGFAPDAFPGTAVTDDRGVYRIFGLAAGEYIVSVSARPRMGNPLAVTDVYQISDADVRRARQVLQGAAPGAATETAARNVGSSRVDYAPVYYPAAIARDEALAVKVGEGEEHSGIDVVLRLMPTASVYGVITSTDGTPQVGAQVSVMEPESASSRVLRSARSGFDGEFAIAGVPPGRYQVWASGSPDRLSGLTEVVVAGRDVDASFTLGPGGTVSGRIVFAGTSKPSAINTVPLFLAQMPRNSFGGYVSDISPDGTFVFSKVPAGTYRLRINGRPPAGWALRSVMLGDVDVSDVLFEVKSLAHIEGVVITLTDRTAEISGTLQTASGEPAPGYTLVVFSADARYWVAGTRRTQHVRPDPQGRYVANNLPAGDYFIGVVTDLEEGEWHDRAFLAELAGSNPLKVTVAEGDRKNQDIRIAR